MQLEVYLKCTFIEYKTAFLLFLQPFPHREFSHEEMSQSLADLGLTPTGSVVIQKQQAYGKWYYLLHFFPLINVYRTLKGLFVIFAESS